MKKLITMALVVLMGAAACQEEGPDYMDNSTPTNGGYITFSADFVSLEAKSIASFDESDNTLTLTWEEGDQVGVYSGLAPILFKAQETGSSTTLTSNVKIAAVSSYSAIYPYMADALMENGSLVLTVPSEQTAAESDLKYHVAVAKTSSNSMTFKNVTAAVRFKILTENVTKIEFKANGGENISGVATVNPGSAAVSALAEGSSVITLVPPADTSIIAPGVYYASLVPQTLSQGFTVTYYAGTKSYEQTSDELLPLDANTLVVCDDFGDSPLGSKTNPFTIGSVDDLKGLAAKLQLDIPNYVKMVRDIDMKGVTSWTPINNNRLRDIAEIHFDGNYKTISNFSPTSVTKGWGKDEDGNEKSVNNASLFGVFYGSCKNLTFKDAYLDLDTTSTTAVVAAIAGRNGNNTAETLFDNVHVSGTVKGEKVVAGFVADICKVKFLNCSADVDVYASANHAGGFVARANDEGCTAIFENCCSKGDVSNSYKKSRYTGSFYGGNDKNANLTFTKCYSTGNVVADYQIGAFIGYVDAGAVNITDCYATGNASRLTDSNNGKQYGGIVGVSKGTLAITRCYYSGVINSGKGESVGGILGLGAAGTATITNCFSTGNLTSPTKEVGGIVGHNKGNTSMTIDGCFASGTLTAPAAVGGIIGMSTVATTVRNCKHNTNVNTIVGAVASGITVTQENNGKLTAAEAANYATASDVAARLGWNTETWDLSGDAPKLK